ncbi:MAG TPA: hypothetical protein VHD84_00385 [Candidatus Saccharimonadales bacterium]|nr:hypothetical protein [Candidatus Saccharimonadales bacterium]
MLNFKRFLTFVLTLVLLAAPFIVWWKAQALTDWWQLRDYTPPAAVANLDRQDTMTPYATHIFYVNHPDIESDVTQFRADCTVAEQAIVLGCYHSNQDGIFIYGVSDSRLNGVEQVTAAHEMLHAAYDRLSKNERNYIDGLLEDYYKNDLKDQRVIDEINGYKQTEPNDVVNEMHSVFGTEVADLPTPLENYYKRYFTDRHVITSYAASYQSEFTSRQDQIKADDAELAQKKTVIDQQEQALNVQLSQINSDRARLDSERNSGNASQYNSDVARFNSEVDAYNQGVDQLKANIAAYNNLVAARNNIASELASLDKDIDTRLVPQATQ